MYMRHIRASTTLCHTLHPSGARTYPSVEPRVHSTRAPPGLTRGRDRRHTAHRASRVTHAVSGLASYIHRPHRERRVHTIMREHAHRHPHTHTHRLPATRCAQRERGRIHWSLDTGDTTCSKLPRHASSGDVNSQNARRARHSAKASSGQSKTPRVIGWWSTHMRGAHASHPCIPMESMWER